MPDDRRSRAAPPDAPHLPDAPRVVVIGKDARTEALLAGCAASSADPCLTGISEIKSPGMIATCEHLVRVTSLGDVDLVVEAVRRATDEAGEPFQLAVIGPEDPLCAGLVDRLESELGIVSFGPRRAHARIEASKSWARELLDRQGIPGNPGHRVFRKGEPAALERYLSELGEYVVKPDGLTGGKGVRVSGDHLATFEEGAAYGRAILEADGLAVVEEKMDGEEFSLQTITDGASFVHCPLVQDHKRAFDGDRGPNTGGMGSYSMPDHSLPWLSERDVEDARAINERVVRALGEELGSPYRGVLYGGFMATAGGVRLVEYNCRFGDPEATNVLSVLRSDLLALCWGASNGSLGTTTVEWGTLATVCKYLVPRGYPSGYPSGEGAESGAGATIDASALGPLVEGGRVRLYWALVNREQSGVVMTGSRALAIVGLGDSLEEAEEAAEQAASLVVGPVRHRRDIGTPELLRRRHEHMERLRPRG